MEANLASKLKLKQRELWLLQRLESFVIKKWLFY